MDKGKIITKATALGIHNYKPGTQLAISGKIRHPRENGHSHIVAFFGFDEHGQHYYVSRDGKPIEGEYLFSLTTGEMCLKLKCPKHKCKGFAVIKRAATGLVQIDGFLQPISPEENGKPFLKKLDA